MEQVTFPKAYTDAFGRLRVSDPVTLFDCKFRYDAQPLLWETFGTGASASHQTDSTVILSPGAATTGNSCVRQTRQYFAYQPGKSHLLEATAVLGQRATGVTRRIGLFDASNGVFFEQTGGDIACVVRNAGTDTRVTQPEWNLDTYPELDERTAQIFFIEIEWLGEGSVWFGVVLDGGRRYLHRFDHANIVTSTYMVTADLPIRYEVNNTGTPTDTATMRQVCCTLKSEGGFESERAYAFSTGSAVAGVTVNSAVRSVVSIRPKATFNSIVVRGMIVPRQIEVSVSSGGTTTARWTLQYNPTLTSASYSSVDSSSIVEADVAARVVSGAGIVIASGIVSSANQFRAVVDSQVAGRLPLTLDNAGANPINLALVVETAANATVWGVLDWSEYR